MFAIKDKRLWLQVFLVNVGEKSLGLTTHPPYTPAPNLLYDIRLRSGSELTLDK